MTRISFLVVLLMVWAVNAQDWQNRSSLRFKGEFGDNYGTIYSITTSKKLATDGTSLFFGIGRQSRDKKKWSAEFMVQRQWPYNETLTAKNPKPSVGQWNLDWRFRRQLTPNWSVYAEPSVLLSKPGFYEFVILERKVMPRISVRVETENTHRLTKQVIAAGGGLGFDLGHRFGLDFAAAAVYRASPTGKDEKRVYLNATSKFAFRRARK
jgi:hypothetical protein